MLPDEKKLSVLRRYLAEAAIVALCFAVALMHRQDREFQKEVRDTIITKLVESTEAIKSSNEAVNRMLSYIRENERK